MAFFLVGFVRLVDFPVKAEVVDLACEKIKTLSANGCQFNI